MNCWVCIEQDGEWEENGVINTQEFGTVCAEHFQELSRELHELSSDEREALADFFKENPKVVSKSAKKEDAKMGWKGSHQNNNSSNGNAAYTAGDYYKDGKWYDKNHKEITFTQTGFMSKCNDHKDPQPVIDYEGMLIYGYKKSDLPIVGGKVLVVNLTGTGTYDSGWPVKKLPECINLLDKKEEYGISYGDELLIDWPDQKGVAIRPQFWADLLKIAKEKGYDRMHVCCIGGHGRTGTALASLMIAARCKGLKDGDDVVDRVRELHCEECIESTAQLDYIDWVCDTFKLPRTKAATI